MNNREKLITAVTHYVNRFDQPLHDMFYAEKQLVNALDEYLINNHINTTAGYNLAVMFRDSISTLEFIKNDEITMRTDNFIMISEYLKV